MSDGPRNESWPGLTLTRPLDVETLGGLIDSGAPPEVLADWLEEREVPGEDVCLLYARDRAACEGLTRLLPAEFPQALLAEWARRRFGAETGTHIGMCRIEKFSYPQGDPGWVRPEGWWIEVPNVPCQRPGASDGYRNTHRLAIPSYSDRAGAVRELKRRALRMVPVERSFKQMVHAGEIEITADEIGMVGSPSLQGPARCFLIVNGEREEVFDLAWSFDPAVGDRKLTVTRKIPAEKFVPAEPRPTGAEMRRFISRRLVDTVRQPAAFSVHLGESVRLQLAVSPVHADISSWTIEFTLRRRPDIAAAIIKRTGHGLAVYAGGLIQVDLSPSDTFGLPPGLYSYEVRRLHPGACTLASGRAELLVDEWFGPRGLTAANPLSGG